MSEENRKPIAWRCDCGAPLVPCATTGAIPVWAPCSMCTLEWVVQVLPNGDGRQWRSPK